MADATSWAPEVFVEGKWSRNALRFATRQEAESNAANLMMRWTLVEESWPTETTAAPQIDGQISP